MSADISSLIDRLWEHTQRDSSTKCWIWLGAKRIGPRDRQGYGIIKFRGEVVGVHRLACWLVHGLKMSNMEVLALHKCNDSRCWNPLHLYLGNGKDNWQDARDKGRR